MSTAVPNDSAAPSDEVPVTYTTVVSEGLEMNVKTWIASSDVPFKGKFLFNHGFCDDVETFNDIWPEFTKKGFEVVAFDQRGAGKTSPGNLFAITNERLVYKDLDKIIEYMTKDYDGKIFLMGHSMGGGITLSYGIKGTYKERISGYLAFAPLVLLHPGTRPNIILRAAIPVCNWLLPNIRVPANVNLDYLTTDPERLAYIKANPKRVQTTAPQMGAMLKRGEMLTEKDYVAQFADRPVVCFHGTGDYINDFKGTVKFFDLLEVSDKKFYRYPGYYHDMFHETPERIATILADMHEWLDKHTGGASGEVSETASTAIASEVDKVQAEEVQAEEVQAEAPTVAA